MTNVNSRFYSPSNYFGTFLGTTLPSLIPKSFSVIKKSFYEHSLFFAANNQAITENSHQYNDLSWAQKFKLGAIKGSEKFLLGLVTVIILNNALSAMPSGQAATSEDVTMLEGLACAVVEEVLFRGVLQNCLAGSQRIVTCVTPQCLQNNRVFKWLTSPSARIISINAMFASVHLLNGKAYLSEKNALIQATKIMLLPTSGILHETTGDIIAPIACHITNNFLLDVLFKFL